MARHSGGILRFQCLRVWVPKSEDLLKSAARRNYLSYADRRSAAHYGADDLDVLDLDVLDLGGRNRANAGRSLSAEVVISGPDGQGPEQCRSQYDQQSPLCSARGFLHQCQFFALVPPGHNALHSSRPLSSEKRSPRPGIPAALFVPVRDRLKKFGKFLNV